MADPVTAGIGIVGLGVQAYSAIKSGNDQADAARAAAAQKEIQAEEVAKSADRQQHLLQIQYQRMKGHAENSFAQNGVEMSGTPLLALEDMARQVNEQSQAIDQEAAFKEQQLRAGADLSNELAGDYSTNGLIGAAGDVLSGAAKVYSIIDPNTGKTKKVGL